jgi:hypothetical protein
MSMTAAPATFEFGHSMPRPSSPLIGMASMLIIIIFLNWTMGVRWVTGSEIFLGPTSLSLILAGYAHVRGAQRMAEASFYIGLWLALPLLGVQSSYLLARADFPLRDEVLAAADSALGFHWIVWARFIIHWNWPNIVLGWAYESHFWQPLVSVAILAWIGPSGRNRELLTQMLFALTATLVIATFVPAIGPADSYGISTAPATLVKQLREGIAEPLPLMGIIWFPSYHAVMAVLFTYAHRSNSYILFAFGILNTFMLVAVPYSGDHYLSDLVGGIILAAATISLTRTGLRHRSVCGKATLVSLTVS